MLRGFVPLKKESLERRDQEPNVIDFASWVVKQGFVDYGLENFGINAIEIDDSYEVRDFQVTRVLSRTKVYL